MFHKTVSDSNNMTSHEPLCKLNLYRKGETLEHRTFSIFGIKMSVSFSIQIPVLI